MGGIKFERTFTVGSVFTFVVLIAQGGVLWGVRGADVDRIGRDSLSQQRRIDALEEKSHQLQITSAENRTERAEMLRRLERMESKIDELIASRLK